MDSVKSRNKKSSSGGFTLIETTIVVTISLLFLASGAGLIKTWMDQNNLLENQQRFTTIQQALANYELQKNRLPCPTSFIAKTTDAAYGREIIASCTGYTPDGTNTFSATGRVVAPNNGAVVIGAVPVRDLGLPDLYRTNIYGYQYTYAVTKSEAATLDNTAGAIDVVSNTNATVLPTAGSALYVLVDHGKDGKGAFSAGSTAANTGSPPAIACGTNAGGMDALNCNYNHANPIQFRSAPFTKTVGPNWYDDSVISSAALSTSGGAKVCKTMYSSSPTGGTSLGHNETGWDVGGGMSEGFIFFYIFEFYNQFYFSVNPLSAGGVSPTAVASCPNASYNVVAGGCSQSLLAPLVVAGHITNIYTADMNPAYSAAQLVLPPLSHPAINTSTGYQGWECNGTTSKNIYTQAYAVCCTNN